MDKPTVTLYGINSKGVEFSMIVNVEDAAYWVEKGFSDKPKDQPRRGRPPKTEE